MTVSPFAMVLAAGIILPMVALAWVTLQPSRRSLWAAVACMSILPAFVLVLVVVVWALGR